MHFLCMLPQNLSTKCVAAHVVPLRLVDWSRRLSSHARISRKTAADCANTLSLLHKDKERQLEPALPMIACLRDRGMGPAAESIYLEASIESTSCQPWLSRQVPTFQGRCIDRLP